jgi:hypothetical protein
MSAARAARRREARDNARRTELRQHGGVVGRLDDGRYWHFHFHTVFDAQAFLKALGPPPASETRLKTALRLFERVGHSYRLAGVGHA